MSLFGIIELGPSNLKKTVYPQPQDAHHCELSLDGLGSHFEVQVQVTVLFVASHRIDNYIFLFGWDENEVIFTRYRPVLI